MEHQATEAQVRQTMAPIFPFLTRTLQRGSQIATTFFAMRGAPVDSALASYIVRWYFLLALRREAQGLGVEHIEELGLSGISFVYRGYHLRVWKADETNVPGLATSSTKQAFFDQQMTFSWMNAPQIALNLAVLWDVDAHWHICSLQIGPPHAYSDRFGLAWYFSIDLDPGDRP